MILNYGTDQHKILKDILTLYLPGEETFECDVTYGSGCFYKHLPRPKYCYDLSPRFDFVEAHRSDQVSQKHRGTLKSIIYDPPYLHAPGVDSIMGNRFGGYKNHSERMGDYYGTLTSAYHALVPGGILVFKCQDIVESGKQKMVHCLVYSEACTNRLEALDFFVLTNSHPIKGRNHSKQQHARKGTSYFWVFRKKQ
jgi:hypothetical protein